MNISLLQSSIQGYLMLDMPLKAECELQVLEKRRPEEATTRLLRLQLTMHLRQWPRAIELAAELCQNDPTNSSLIIQHAVCLHEAGSTEEAIQRLVQGPNSLRRSPIFYYNLGCYHARLGRIDDATALLRQSFRMDQRLADFARTDPDLEELRDQLPAA